MLKILQRQQHHKLCFLSTLIRNKNKFPLPTMPFGNIRKKKELKYLCSKFYVVGNNKKSPLECEFFRQTRQTEKINVH